MVMFSQKRYSVSSKMTEKFDSNFSYRYRGFYDLRFENLDYDKKILLGKARRDIFWAIYRFHSRIELRMQDRIWNPFPRRFGFWLLWRPAWILDVMGKSNGFFVVHNLKVWWRKRNG